MKDQKNQIVKALTTKHIEIVKLNTIKGATGGSNIVVYEDVPT